MDNPFISQIKSDGSKLLDSVELLTSEDYESYLIYEETHKVHNPQAYRFLNKPIDFIAFQADSINTIASMVLYIKYSTDLFELLNQEFGPPTNKFSLSGEMYTNFNEKIRYESIAWKKGNYEMMTSFPQDTVKIEDKSDSWPPTRIWIKRLNTQ